MNRRDALMSSAAHPTLWSPPPPPGAILVDTDFGLQHLKIGREYEVLEMDESGMVTMVREITE